MSCTFSFSQNKKNERKQIKKTFYILYKGKNSILVIKETFNMLFTN